MCCVCRNTTWLMFTVAGSKRTGVQPAVICHVCHKKWKAYEVEMPSMEVRS